MTSDLASSLRRCAEVIVRVGLNLQPGQRLLIAEPYELQGVSRDASALIAAIAATVVEAGCPHPAVIWGDPAQLRRFAEQADWRGFTQLVSTHARGMKNHLAEGGAFLFPISSFPQLMQGIAADRVSELRRISWEHFGPIVQRLTRGETQWSLVPAASPAWAEAAFVDLPEAERLPKLEETVFQSLRIPTEGEALRSAASWAQPIPPTSPLEAWRTHLAALVQQRDTLNQKRYKTLRYQGPGTDLTVKLPSQHRWCTAQLTTKGGLTYVANLPTEEVFTAPSRDSAEGCVRVARPVNYGGTVIDGIELEFRSGRVVTARARTGSDLLQRLLATDEGACRLGEVAIVSQPGSPSPPEANWQDSGRLFYHTLLDENAANHIALGESYPFCSSSLFSFGLNRSLVHVDLPLDAQATFG